MIQVERMDSCAGPLTDHEIDPKVFHRGIQDFFNRRLQAMDFVEEENFALLERRQDGG